MRAALLALVLCAAPAAAEVKTDWMNLFGGPAAPHLFAWDMDDRGLSRWPHDERDGIVNGAGWVLWTRAGHHWTEGKRSGSTVDAGLRLQGRLGGDVSWAQYGAGAFRNERRSEWYDAHATADLSTRDATTIEYGFGLASYQGDRPKNGVSVELRVEQRLAKPLTLFSRYAPALLGDGRVWHPMSAGFGVNYKRAGLDGGFRALLNPLGNVYGPEVGFRLWL